MEQKVCHFEALNGDVLADIIGRLDGSTLAAAACTCSDLRDIARDQCLWKQLRHSTWPSTALEEANLLLSSSPIGSFHKFYANSYPLLLHGKHIKSPELKTHATASQFASLVDLYYRKECVLSKVLDGIPQAADGNSRRWYSNCPFKLELLSLDYDEVTRFDNELGYAYIDDDDEERRGPPSISVSEDEKLRHDHCKELEEKLRLSWVLLDKKKGKTVNLSSWKPVLVQSRWPFSADYVIHFGSIVLVDESLLSNKLAMCKIVVGCKLRESGGCPKWRELSMHIEHLTGASVGGSKSLMVLNHALDCLRSTNHHEVKQGFRQYEKRKREMMRKNELRETLIEGFCVSIEVAIFVTLCYIYLFL